MNRSSPAGTTTAVARPAIVFSGLVLLGCVVFAAGCASVRRGAAAASAPSAAELFPLRAGASWTFEKPGGPARVLEIGPPNSAEQFPLFVVADDGGRVPLARISIEGDGALVLRSPEGVQVLLREPIRSGAIWEWESSAETGARRRARVESIEERELAGVVRTHVVVSYGAPGAAPNERYRFARGVGWVGIERRNEEGGGFESLDLRAFSPGRTQPDPESTAPATGG